MKTCKLYLVMALLMVSLGNTLANPVDLSLAQTAAQKFAEAKFAFERQNTALDLVYTGAEDAFFVFNIGDKGFVIIAADDAYRPVIGYSNESTFNPNDIPPALVDYLDGIAMSINRLRRRGNAMPTPIIAAEWESMLTKGELLSRIGGKGVDYLCQTKWDQSDPYNYCCPDDPNGSGGHAIVGCLATAMSQLMRFWAYPAQGIGNHCYNHEDYGQICADFGNTTYDWDHMPNVLTSNSSEEEKIATGTLCFHCGVTIDMGYGPDGSGGASGPIPNAMHQYFNYCDAIVQLSRNDFETETWKTMVREQFDMGWPMYYGGCQDGGCHAFVCDGYDDKDMFHFNLGWGGGYNGWYLIDDAPYTSPADAMFNFVPTEVYGQTPNAPTNLTVNPVADTELKASLHWTNPTTTQDGTPLSSIQEVIVLRDNEIIQTITDVTPGATLEFEDANVPRFDVFHYAVYVVANDRHGRHADVQNVAVGPTCPWKIVMSSSNYHGWNGGYITVYNNAGHEVGRCTLESATPSMIQPALPLGLLSFGWTAPEETVSSMTISIKDAEGNTVYTFNGSSDELDSGIFFEVNNGCGSSVICDTPENLAATDTEEDHILLTWDAVGDEGYGYNIYRDGVLCRLVQSGTSFLDEQAPIGGHCYQISVLCEGGEGPRSNITCGTEGPCYPPRNLSYELTESNKVKLNWEAPVETDNQLVYYVYRKKNDGEFKRVKVLSPSTLTYTDMTHLTEDDYYYKILANYVDLDCFSAPANVLNEPNTFELHIHYVTTDVNEHDSALEITPNPTKGNVIITGKGLREIEVYNIVGQSVAYQKADGDITSIDLSSLPSGLFFVHVIDGNGNDVVRKLVKQ